MARASAGARRQLCLSSDGNRHDGLPTPLPAQSATSKMLSVAEADSDADLLRREDDADIEGSAASLPIVESEASGELFSRAPSISESSPSTAATAPQDEQTKHLDNVSSPPRTRSSSSLQVIDATSESHDGIATRRAASGRSRRVALDEAEGSKSSAGRNISSQSPRRSVRSPRRAGSSGNAATPIRRDVGLARRIVSPTSSLSDPSDDEDAWTSSGNEETSSKKVPAPAWKKKAFMPAGLYCNHARTHGPRTVNQLKGKVLPMPIHHGLALLDESRNFRIPEHYFEQAGTTRDKLEAKRKPPPYRKIRSNVYTSRPKLGGEIPICHCDPTSNCGDNCMNRLLQYICNPKVCPCGESCTNGSLGSRPKAGFEIHNYGQRGFGIRAVENISEGTFIAEYCGEVIDMDEATRRVTSHYKTSGNYYFLDYDTAAGEVLDAGLKGNETRFINHSCDPNCFVERWLLCGTDEALTGEFQIGITALRDIAAGEELTYDYGWSDFSNSVDEEAAPRCLCGSANCSGFLGGKKKRPAPAPLTSLPKAGKKKGKAAKGRSKKSLLTTTSLARKGTARTKQRLKAAIARTAAVRKEKRKERKRLHLPPASQTSPRLGSLPSRGPRTPGKLFTKPARSLYNPSALEQSRMKIGPSGRRTRRSMAAAQSLQNILGIVDANISSDAVFKELQDREDARIRARNARRSRAASSEASDGDADDEDERGVQTRGAKRNNTRDSSRLDSNRSINSRSNRRTGDRHPSSSGSMAAALARHSRRSNAAAKDTSSVLGVDASKLSSDAFFKAIQDEADAKKRARRLARAAAASAAYAVGDDGKRDDDNDDGEGEAPARERYTRTSGAAASGLSSALGLDITQMSSDAVFKAMQDQADARKRAKRRKEAARADNPEVPSPSTLDASLQRATSVQSFVSADGVKCCDECGCTDAKFWRRSQDRRFLLCNRCWQRSYQRLYREKKRVDRQLGLAPPLKRRKPKRRVADTIANQLAEEDSQRQSSGAVTGSVTGIARWLSDSLFAPIIKRQTPVDTSGSLPTVQKPRPKSQKAAKIKEPCPPRICAVCGDTKTSCWRRGVAGHIMCNRCWQKEYTKRKSGEKREKYMRKKDAGQASGSTLADAEPARLIHPSLHPYSPSITHSASVEPDAPNRPTWESSSLASGMKRVAGQEEGPGSSRLRPSKRARFGSKPKQAEHVEIEPEAEGGVAKAMTPSPGLLLSRSSAAASPLTSVATLSSFETAAFPLELDPSDSHPSDRSCIECGATSTPTWRKNEDGQCICNRCGQKRFSAMRQAAKLKVQAEAEKQSKRHVERKRQAQRVQEDIGPSSSTGQPISKRKRTSLSSLDSLSAGVLPDGVRLRRDTSRQLSHPAAEPAAATSVTTHVTPPSSNGTRGGRHDQMQDVKDSLSTRSRPTSSGPIEVAASDAGSTTSRRSPADRATPVPRPSRRNGGGRVVGGVTLPPVLDTAAAEAALAEAERRFLLEQQQDAAPDFTLLEDSAGTGETVGDGKGANATVQKAGEGDAPKAVGNFSNLTSAAGTNALSGTLEPTANMAPNDTSRAAKEEEEDMEEEPSSSPVPANLSGLAVTRPRRSTLGAKCELCGKPGASWKMTVTALRAVCSNCM